MKYLNLVDFVIGAAMAVAVLVIVASILTAANTYRSVPQCQEDVVLIGVGEFEHGRWEGYECGPARDDYR